jgi:hypothetical protein
MNEEHLAASGPDAALEGRINSFELALRMRTAAPDLQNLSSESEATQKLYGLDNPRTANFGRQCLMARRFAERGVRFIQCTHSDKWDQHGNLKTDHAKNAEEVDQPISALLTDLKSRGLLDDTLILRGGGPRGCPRPHTGRSGGRRPRPQPARRHHVARRRRRESLASATAKPTTTATTPSKTKSTCTTCTPSCCTCWASITPN